LIYQIFIEKSAQKKLSIIPEPFQGKIIAEISLLAENPRPAGCKKLTGRNAWRIRTGKYRAIYEINDKDKSVLVVTIGHRKDVYR
jgi:mRNA interferase RelE/StbE